MARLSDEDLARRIRAAAAYGGLSREEAAATLGVSPSVWSRLTGRKGSEIQRATRAQQRALAQRVGLPPAFFDIDLRRLPEIASDTVRLPISDELLDAAEAIVTFASRSRRDGALATAEATEAFDPQPEPTREPGVEEGPGPRRPGRQVRDR